MKIDIIYPVIEKKKLRRSEVLIRIKWPLIATAYICLIINLCVGGKAWSLITVWSLYMLWSIFFSIDVVEYNRISQTIKVATQSCIMLILIDRLLAPGWAAEVVPIVCFSSLIIVAILFFTNITRQRHNMRPMFLLILLTFTAAVLGLIFIKTVIWPYIVMCSLSVALFIACIKVMGESFINDLKKLFHAK